MNKDNSHNNLHCNNNYLFKELWHKDGRLGIPFTLNIVSQYGESILAETILEVNDFITFVFQFILDFGILLQLPIIMSLRSLSGLTDSKFR